MYSKHWQSILLPVATYVHARSVIIHTVFVFALYMYIYIVQWNLVRSYSGRTLLNKDTTYIPGSTKDTTYAHSIIPTIHFEPPNDENSLQRTNPLNLCRPQTVLNS